MGDFIEKQISVYEYILVKSNLVFYVNLLNATQFMLGKHVTASLSKWDSNLCNVWSPQTLGAPFPEWLHWHLNSSVVPAVLLCSRHLPADAQNLGCDVKYVAGEKHVTQIPPAHSKH